VPIVSLHPAAEEERSRLETRERTALDAAIEKLSVLGIRLGHPHSSKVHGHDLRELRPRQGRSRTRAFYRQIGPVFVIAGVGPDAEHDAQGYRRTASRSAVRLAALVP
jgi:hypothetical protein